MLQGKVKAVSIGKFKHVSKKQVAEIELVPQYGAVEDAHAGESVRQVSLISWENVERFSREHDIPVNPGDFAENIATQEIDLLQFPVGTELKIGSARLRITEIGKDKSIPHEFSYHGYALLMDEGIFCKVLEGGKIRPGTPVLVEKVNI